MRKQLQTERKVLSVAQDAIHSASNSKVKLPKHISLPMAIRDLTGSKELITLLNRMGHCSSFDEVEAVDISLAIKVTVLLEQMGTIILSNISPGLFIQIAADKNAVNEETLDGENMTHATTTVAYHRKQCRPQPLLLCIPTKQGAEGPCTHLAHCMRYRTVQCTVDGMWSKIFVVLWIANGFLGRVKTYQAQLWTTVSG